MPISRRLAIHLFWTALPILNVLKVKGLSEGLQQIGMAVSFDYKEVTPDAVITTGCTVTDPVTYALKALFIINQGEIR